MEYSGYNQTERLKVIRELKHWNIWSSPDDVDNHGNRLQWRVFLNEDRTYAVGDRGIIYKVGAVCLENGAVVTPTEHKSKWKADQRYQALAEVIGGYIRTIVDTAPGYTTVVRNICD